MLTKLQKYLVHRVLLGLPIVIMGSWFLAFVDGLERSYFWWYIGLFGIGGWALPTIFTVFSIVTSKDRKKSPLRKLVVTSTN